MKIGDGPQDLDKLLGAGNDLWESEEEWEEWLAMLDAMRHPEKELQAELAETRGQLWEALEALQVVGAVMQEKRDRVAGLCRTIDEERANHAAVRRNLEGQIVAARRRIYE